MTRLSMPISAFGQPIGGAVGETMGRCTAPPPYQMFPTVNSSSTDRYVAVVDGLSSGSLLAPVLRERGYSVVHVRSSVAWRTPNIASFVPEDYDVQLVHRGDPYHMTRESQWLTECAMSLAKYAPLAVFAGAESGVILADYLSDRLALPSNGVQQSQARRNKSLMAAAIEDAGVDVARYLRAHSAYEILQWMRINEIEWPVFLKPETSGGTRGVAACYDDQQVLRTFNLLYGKPNGYGIIDDAVLAQEYIKGTEYAFNTVSVDGRHHATGIWEYGRTLVRGAATVYDWDKILPFHGEVQDRLTEYGFKVLNALGVRHGPAHLEIKDTPDGPRLIEMGARLYGSRLPLLEMQATNRRTVELAIDALLNPHALAPLTTGYDLLKHAAVVTLKSEREGGRMSHAYVGRVRELEGHHHDWFVEPGTLLKRTIDTSGEIGEVWLLHPDEAAVGRSMRTLREWERSGCFVE